MDPDVPAAKTLPDDLTSRDQWVCWRIQERSGRETKVPINPHTGSFGSATNEDSWASFETAREYAIDGAADGLGFVFTAEDPLVGIDLDTCRVPETGTLTDDAGDIVERVGSYTEVSPSGTGVHVLARGSLPGDRSRKDWVEMYDDARFFTVTGEHLEGTPITVESRAAAISAVHAEFVAGEADSSTDDETEQQGRETPEADTASDSPEPDDQTAAETGDGLSDEEVVERAHAAANGEKFERLWSGRTTGYDSHSEADMALCALLAFWTGGDRTQMDRLFRDSGLIREKWDERHFADGSTYGEKTVERVLEGTNEFYEPAQSRSAAGRTSEESDTNDTGEATAETVALRQRLEELTTREDRHRTVIADLETQVERLEARNQRLTEELETAESEAGPESESDEDQPDSESDSLLRRIRNIATRRGT
ncbi:MAG: hypothetical protein ABEJ26_09785 [Halosimplex sp.]